MISTPLIWNLFSTCTSPFVSLAIDVLETQKPKEREEKERDGKGREGGRGDDMRGGEMRGNEGR